MNKLYTFNVPFHGLAQAYVEAESEEEAFAMVHRGDWDDADEVTYETESDKAVLIRVEELYNTEEIFE